MEKRPIILPCGCGGENKPLSKLRLLVAALERKEQQRYSPPVAMLESTNTSDECRGHVMRN
jgi:hypothetical protein